MAKSRDLFDESTMTFGEHLEALRYHLIKALIGLVAAVILTLSFGNHIVDLIRSPIDQALKRNKLYDEKESDSYWSQFSAVFGHAAKADPEAAEPASAVSADQETIVVHVKPSDLSRLLHQADPERYPAAKPVEDEKALALPLSAKEFDVFRKTSDQQDRPVTLNVQEAFMMYIKVAFISAAILAAPWVFYQFWQFVAAGLYPHERRYVHVYMPLSIALFVVGAAFSFFVALPVLLDFLLSYNRWLHVTAQIRLSEWVGFVILLPLMFGISFQLPLVMLFLERIGIFKTTDYRAKWRIAYFTIAVLAMVLSPGGDPGSMMLMFIPLILLYEMGILLCNVWKTKQPFEEPALS